MTFRLVVLSAGLSQPSSTRLLADRLAAAASARLRGAGQEVDVTTLELRPLAHDITDAMLSGFPSGALTEALEAVAQADALIAVTPVFAGTFSGLFKSFIDVVPRGDLAGTPGLIGATGGSSRHSLAVDHALRPLFSYHQAVTVPTGVFAATSDFGAMGSVRGAGLTDGAAEADGLSMRIERAAQELVRLSAPAAPAPSGLDGDAVWSATAPGAPTAPSIARTREEDTNTQFTPFSELLAARRG